jgi:hypothetical protein
MVASRARLCNREVMHPGTGISVLQINDCSTNSGRRLLTGTTARYASSLRVIPSNL